MPLFLYFQKTPPAKPVVVEASDSSSSDSDVKAKQKPKPAAKLSPKQPAAKVDIDYLLFF